MGRRTPTGATLMNTTTIAALQAQGFVRVPRSLDTFGLRDVFRKADRWIAVGDCRVLIFALVDGRIALVDERGLIEEIAPVAPPQMPITSDPSADDFDMLLRFSTIPAEARTTELGNIKEVLS
jgi:hypothetical protein